MQLSSTSAWSSESVELFLLDPADVTPAYVDWLNDPQVNRYLESRFERHTLESTRAFVSGCASNEQTLFLGIRYRPLANRHVGNVKLELNRKHGLAEVGILIGEKEVHGKGIATQTLLMIARIARDELRLRKLTAGCYDSNKGSQRAFIKAGFVVEARRPEHFMLDGKPEALTLMGRNL